MKLIVMCGLPDSGKSTKATALAVETGATLIRLDDYKQTSEEQSLLDFVKSVLADVKAALETGEDVVYDAVNATIFDRALIKEMCAIEGCQVECVYMETPLEVCLARPKASWSKLFNQIFEPPTEAEGFEVIVCYDGVDNTPPEPTDSDVLNALLGVTE